MYYFFKFALYNNHKSFQMSTIHSNRKEAFKGRRNIFRHSQQRSEVFGKLSEIFGGGLDVFGNPAYDEAKISRV